MHAIQLMRGTRGITGAALGIWFALPGPERRVLGRLALAALVLAFTRSTLAAACVFYVIDRLTD